MQRLFESQKKINWSNEGLRIDFRDQSHLLVSFLNWSVRSYQKRFHCPSKINDTDLLLIHWYRRPFWVITLWPSTIQKWYCFPSSPSWFMFFNCTSCSFNWTKFRSTFQSKSPNFLSNCISSWTNFLSK